MNDVNRVNRDPPKSPADAPIPSLRKEAMGVNNPLLTGVKLDKESLIKNKEVI